LKKRFGLVLIETTKIATWAIRLFCLLFASNFANEFIELLEAGSFYRRGNFYTLVDNPTSFYIRATKYGVFCILAFWYMTIGTKVTSET